MADFVDCDFNATVPENESIDIFENNEPPAKKKRGPNVKYDYVEEAESYDDLKEKVENAGLKIKEKRGTNVYIDCKTSSCCYKWKATKTDDFKYLIYKTECEHDHGNVVKKAGLTNKMKDIVDKRMKGNERINAGAVIQAYLNAGITELPTSMQINNYVSNKKRTLEISGDFNFVDMENMVREIKETESEVVEFKYRIDEENPSKTDWEIIITCKQMLDDQRNQKHGNIDSTFKLIFGGFPVMVWGYSDINRHIHPTGVAIISSETIETYKWLFEFLKSNRFCNGEWIPAEFVADNAQCITTALREVFPEVHRRNCIAHIIRHIFDVKFGEYGIDKQTDGERIKNEILELANHAFENHFDIAGAALIAKWKASDHEGIVQFADYFDREYIQKNKFWYAANGQGIRQNNGMEGSNKWIKRDFINRRLPLMEAIAALKKWLYVCAHKNYGNPAISVKTNEWIAAHDLKSVTKVIFSGGTWYVRRSKSEWDETDYRDYLEYYTDLDNVLDAGDVELFQKNIVVVTRSTLYENEFTCNCPIGALRTRCKHVLLIQVFCNHREWPNMPALRQTINGTARTRPGRPRKHTQALSRI